MEPTVATSDCRRLQANIFSQWLLALLGASTSSTFMQERYVCFCFMCSASLNNHRHTSPCSLQPPAYSSRNASLTLPPGKPLRALKQTRWIVPTPSRLSSRESQLNYDLMLFKINVGGINLSRLSVAPLRISTAVPSCSLVFLREGRRRDGA